MCPRRSGMDPDESRQGAGAAPTDSTEFISGNAVVRDSAMDRIGSFHSRIPRPPMRNYLVSHGSPKSLLCAQHSTHRSGARSSISVSILTHSSSGP